MYGIKAQILLIYLWHPSLGFLQPKHIRSVWKIQLFENVFQPWGLFDTPKNRVVTSEVIWLLFSESQFKS